MGNSIFDYIEKEKQKDYADAVQKLADAKVAFEKLSPENQQKLLMEAIKGTAYEQMLRQLFCI